MLRKLAMLCVFAACAAPAAAQEVIIQDGPPPALRKNLDAFKAAVNAGAADQYEAMAKAAFTPELLASRTPAQRKAEFDKIRAAFGTVAFERIERNGGPDAPLQVFIKGSTASGVIWIGLDEDTSRFTSVKPEWPVKKDANPRR